MQTICNNSGKLLARRGAWFAFFLAWGLGSSRAEPARLRVLTSCLPLYCFTTNLTGARAQIDLLLPSAASAHDFQLTRGDLLKIRQADLVVVNGLGLEGWLARALQSRSKQQPVVELSAGLAPPRLIASQAAPAHAGESSPGSAFNPHIWLDPALVCHGVSNIWRALETNDPAGGAIYRDNAARYLDRLRQLDQELARMLAPVSNAPIVTYHDAFAYFARRYGLRVVGLMEPVAEVDPSPRYLVTLSRTVRREGVKAVFTELGVRPLLLRRLARDWDVPVGTLSSLETGALSGAVYEEVLRANARELLRCLQ